MLIWIPFATPVYDESIRLRTDILRTPLGLSFFAKDLAEEYAQHHLVYFDQNGAVGGCLVLLEKEPGVYKMRQVAVSEALQHQGIGKLMVVESERFVRSRGGHQIILSARKVAVPFYEKLDYEITGDEYEEVNIPHFKMKKDL